MNFLHSCDELLGTLTSVGQNGLSLWGTIIAPTLPLWMPGSGGSDGLPWPGLTAGGSNPYIAAPNTGVTRYYEFNVSRGMIAPDGYNKSVLLVNGQFPGPLVEANWGDYIEVTVNNEILEGPPEPEGTTMHWHGFLQTRTPWWDGTPGVDQCPIAPGKSMTYKIRAELYGSSWYHSHYSSQWSGGLFGPIVVYGPTNLAYDIDLGPVMVNDWYHEDYFTVVEEVLSPNFTGEALSDNNLINGKMAFDCSTVAYGDTHQCVDDAPISKFKFESGKSHRLRFINSGSQGTERVSIDGHNMTVIANDFVEVEPYDTEVVTLGIGQRVDVVVYAHADPAAAFWLRANLSTTAGARQPYAVAAIYYEDADTNLPPNSTAWDVPDPGTGANDPLEETVPFYPIALKEPSWIGNFQISAYRNATGSLLWSWGGGTARVDYNDPTLEQANSGNLTFGPEDNLINFGDHNTSVRFIVNNASPAPHPIHAHGMNMFILAEGPGNYNGTEVVRPSNPMRRDVQLVQPLGHIVVQMDVTNPGIWPFHCHIAWHASAGFFAQMLFLPGQVEQYQIPPELQQVCRDWDAFTNKVVVDDIDSGV
ncbi:multicopper oxidase [Xylariaceae sp. FL0804]|nr:multicopper oxidase [Xylariaceae sp. FL0804]